uniref:WRKY19-like zinc finger domain-containing protein n=1 Tax=Oryza meridionalis TaxID=40149 RepID=A0A0E0CMC5_9ORYZ
MNNGFAEIIRRGNPHLMDNSAVVIMGHSVASYTMDSHGRSSSCLDHLGSSMENSSIHGKRGNSRRSGHGVSAQDDGCGLVLGLGPSPEMGSSAARRSKAPAPAPATLFSQRSFSFTEPGVLNLGLHRGDHGGATIQHLEEAPAGNIISFAAAATAVDEGSTSARRSSGGYMPSLLFAPRPNASAPEEARHDVVADHTDNTVSGGGARHGHARRRVVRQLSPEPEPEPSATMTETSFGVSSDVVTAVTNPVTTQPAASAAQPQRRHPKKCRFKGCSKGARGASGLCIAHGGGQRCQKPGCHKGAESRTAYCKAHGGGRRCMQLGCTKSAEGKTDHCIAHGGGRRCGHQGCPKAARGKSGRCIKHGGGKRCSVEGCIRSAEGRVGLCISHGGGRRCQYPDCRKGAQGSTLYCKAHGGGKRCVFDGCLKGAEGSTPLCKAHGGGKRCMVDGCAKSAQGSTEFCKAHGGGKRCTWATGCEKFARGRSGLCAAHGTLMASQQRRAGAGGGSMIGPGLFHGLVAMNNGYSSSGVSTASEYSDACDGTARRQELIPPQVLVPNSMKSSCSSAPPPPPSSSSGRGREGGGLVVPEGRVHGGGLLSLLGGSFRNVDVDEL